MKRSQGTERGVWAEEENTYEDDVQEVGERVDEGDEEEGNQARDANLVGVNLIRGVRIWMWRRSSGRRDRLTMSSDRGYRVVALLRWSSPSPI
jgi:hypothetical protein